MTAVGSDVAQPAPPCVLVIFGGTGDLTRRLLMPALRNLRRDGLLAENFALIGLGSRDIGDEGFRQHLREGMEHFKAGAGGSDIDWFVRRAYSSGRRWPSFVMRPSSACRPTISRCTFSPMRVSRCALA
jgi:hypothetical protein